MIVRAGARAAAGSAGVQPCITSLLAFKLGAGVDPCITEPTRQLQLWMRIWGEASLEEKEGLRDGWRASRDILTPIARSKRWSRVSGPVIATVCVLLHAELTPLQPHIWSIPSERAVAILGSTPWANANILDFFATYLQRRARRAASGHFLGKGLEQGVPAFGPAQRCRRQLLKRQLFTGC